MYVYVRTCAQELGSCGAARAVRATAATATVELGATRTVRAGPPAEGPGGFFRRESQSNQSIIKKETQVGILLKTKT